MHEAGGTPAALDIIAGISSDFEARQRQVERTLYRAGVSACLAEQNTMEKSLTLGAGFQRSEVGRQRSELSEIVSFRDG